MSSSPSDSGAYDVSGTADLSDVGQEVGTALAELRSALVAQFGHAILDVEVDVDERRCVVNLTGQVASAPTAARVVAAVMSAAPGWQVDGRGLAELRTGVWRKLPAGVTPVSVSPAGPSLSTELVGGDGPVEVLARLGASTFVRTARGTLGWVERPLGGPTPGPAASRPIIRASLTSVAAAWLGTPYRMGGTLPSGIDCSGFLLRCFEAAWGVRLPRHSTDQIPDEIVSRHDRIRPGDAIILREPAGWAHVGLIGPQTRAGIVVLHAATTQGRVVAEPLDDLVADCHDVGVAPLEALLEFHGQ